MNGFCSENIWEHSTDSLYLLFMVPRLCYQRACCFLEQFEKVNLLKFNQEIELCWIYFWQHLNASVGLLGWNVFFSIYNKISGKYPLYDTLSHTCTPSFSKWQRVCFKCLLIVILCWAKGVGLCLTHTHQHGQICTLTVKHATVGHRKPWVSSYLILTACYVTDIWMEGWQEGVCVGAEWKGQRNEWGRGFRACVAKWFLRQECECFPIQSIGLQFSKHHLERYVCLCLCVYSFQYILQLLSWLNGFSLVFRINQRYTILVW